MKLDQSGKAIMGGKRMKICTKREWTVGDL
jgi:hypothetical protein